jgi:arylsulfatase A-like enzyme
MLMREINRREFLKAAGAGAGLAALARLAPAAEAGAAGKRPNVIVLLTDDQRGDTIAALGNTHIQTPNLDTLVKEGLVFRNAYCAGGNVGAVCLPARQMILRGRSYFSPRFKDWQEQNFPKTMNEAGYFTYFLGKAGNNDSVVLRVFQSVNFDDKKGGEVVPGQVMADGVIAFLADWKKQRDAGTARPFFMHLAPPHPHDPRSAPKEFMDRYDAAKMPLPANYLPFHPFDNGEMFVRDECLASWPRTEEEIRRHLRDYYADITCLDDQIGRILLALKDIGEYENTVIIFTGDQGVAIGSHGLLGKQNLYEDSMNVPVIFRGPGIPKGKVSDAFAYHFDIYPTVCDLTGAKPPDAIDGKDLAPVIRGKADGVRDTIFLAYKGVQRAVRRGQWKLIRYPEIDRTQLFDLAADPRETKDLSADPAQAGKVKELTALLAEEQKRFGDTLPLEVADAKPGDVNLDFFAARRQEQKAKQPKTKQQKAKK